MLFLHVVYVILIFEMTESFFIFCARVEMLVDAGGAKKTPSLAYMNHITMEAKDNIKR